MSSNQPPLGPYQIGQRVGAQVWMAEDTRNGKTVAVKLLSKQLPKDAVKRDALVRDVRIAAALYHTFLVPILEIAAVGDNLLMVMEPLEARTLTKHVAGNAMSREEFFRIAWQLVDVVKYLHVKDIIHGNINGDSVMILPNSQVKLGGLNLLNLIRRDSGATAYQQKGSDPRSVSYMAPEQITAQTVDERTDVFSAGVVMYEMATGRLPFPGNSAPEIARAIVEGQPVSPKAVNPSLDAGIMSILGGCLFKDAFKRFKDSRATLEAIGKLDPNAVTFAQQLEKKVTTASSSTKESRRSIFLVADVSTHYDDTGEEARAHGRMQQIIGESVYLFDGKVIDPFAPRLVAEMPSVEAALEAGRKAEFDFSPEQQTDEHIDVRMLLHAGELELHDGEPAGPAVEKAFDTVRQVPPNTLFITEEFVKEGRGNVRLRDAGARGGLKLYTIVPAEPVKVEPTELETGQLEAQEAAEAAALAAGQAAAKKRRMRSLAIAAAGLILFAAGLGVMWQRREKPADVAETTAVAAPSGPQRPSAANPRKVLVGDFTVEGADPAMQDRATAIRLGTIEVLRSFPELRVAEESAPDVVAFSARVRAGAAGPEIVPTSGPDAGAAAPAPDVASGIAAMVQWVSSRAELQPRPQIAAAAAMNAFGDALLARSANDPARTEAALRTALTADPNFLSAQLVAMKFFEESGKPSDALAAAKQVVALDPSNLDATRKVGAASLALGDLQQAFGAYGALLRKQPQDVEALNLVARYSVGGADAQRFNATLAKLKRVESTAVAAHEPDLLASQGRLDAAAQRYYDVENAAPANPAVALKIGRLAVLRHSLEIADIEQKKLAQSDPLYGLHVVQAYIAAEKRDRATAEAELKSAMAASIPGDETWTCAAEVYAILADTGKVLESLEKAAARKEPTAAYVLANPLFRYLGSDPRFEKLQATLTAQQQEIRTALAQVP